MKEKWFALYESMQREIENCVGRDTDFKAEIECCFNISLKYWSEIELGTGALHFDSTHEEIEFYKTVKPLFKSQIEYYNLVYQSQLFKPVYTSELKEFWLKEHERLDKFIQTHRAFYDYYKTGATHLDEAYFLSLDYKDSRGNAIYHDNLIAMLLALERYMSFVQNELGAK